MVGFSIFTGGAYHRPIFLRLGFFLVWGVGMILLGVLYMGVAVGTPMYGIAYASAGVAVFAPWIFALGAFVTCLNSGGAGTIVGAIVLNNMLLFVVQFFTLLGSIFYWSFSSKIFWYCATAKGRLGSVDLAVCEDELWLEAYTWAILGVLVPIHAAILCLCVIGDSAYLFVQANRISGAMKDYMAGTTNMFMDVARGFRKPIKQFVDNASTLITSPVKVI